MAQLEIFPFDDFPSYVKAVLAERRRCKQPGSVRWLAKRIGLKTHTFLSHMLAGQKMLSSEALERLLQFLDLEDQERAFAKALIAMQFPKSEREQEAAADQLAILRRRRQETTIASDAFRFISEWYHVAILELIDFPGFAEDPGWIAGKLDHEISEAIVAESLDRLQRLKLVERDQLGALKRTSQSFQTTHGVSDAAIRRFHQQMLGKAERALALLGVDRRCFLGQMMPMEGAHLPRAVEELQDFRRLFASRFTDPKGGQLYYLALQIFPVTAGADR